MNAEQIRALGDLWRLGIVIVVIVALVVFRNQLRGFIDRSTHWQVERGGTKLLVSSERQAIVLSAPLEKPGSPEVSKDQSEVIQSREATSPRDLWIELFEARDARDLERVERTFLQMQKSEDDETRKLQNETMHLWMRYDLGDPDALSALEKYVNTEVSYDAHYWLGLAYAKAGDLKRASEEYAAALTQSKSDGEKARIAGPLSRSLAKDGKLSEALSVIGGLLASFTDPDAASIAYEALAETFGVTGEQDLRAFAFEKALESRPNNPEIRFGAAYAYSEVEFEHLSLLHYGTLIGFKPDHTNALNNLGVQYDRLQMPFTSVRYYRQAKEKRETLAASNLAYRYIGAGFGDEAEEVLSWARHEENVHPNVGRASASLSDKLEAEVKREKEVLDIGRAHQRFIADFADAYFRYRENPIVIDGRWRWQSGAEVVLSLRSGNLQAEWLVDGKKFRFEGEIHNYGLRLRWQKMSYGFLSEREIGFEEDGVGFGYFLETGIEFRALHRTGTDIQVRTLSKGT